MKYLLIFFSSFIFFTANAIAVCGNPNLQGVYTCCSPTSSDTYQCCSFDTSGSPLFCSNMANNQQTQPAPPPQSSSNPPKNYPTDGCGIAPRVRWTPICCHGRWIQGTCDGQGSAF